MAMVSHRSNLFSHSVMRARAVAVLFSKPTDEGATVYKSEVTVLLFAILEFVGLLVLVEIVPYKT